MNLQDFKNKHDNQDVYIICSGKSIDFIDKSFFDNKITIGINQVDKFLSPTYLVRKEIPDNFQLPTNSLMFVSEFKCGNKQVLNPKYSNVVYFKHDNNVLELLNIPDEGKLVVSYSSITTGIHLAAHMGAKNIILVGHDCGTLDGEMNFKGYHTNDTLKIAWGETNHNVKYSQWVSRNIEHHTIKLKGILKNKYGCNVYSLNPFINFNLENHVYRKV